ncbi:uncharacterized protein Dana_GF24551 [Drosophila ananassae]|uniref:Palmitoyltransferase n=1 Tax=Drosophila ananassae TaxID=7217 RepID=B3M467_DROAN|nr:probable palmitoyltransferase ZDHHC24 [Drosophila ananassae]EDV39337.2 uncharacterized protein Dana_GF24551 [Drosophila ananassae]
MSTSQQNKTRYSDILSILTTLVVTSFFFTYDVYYIVPTILDPLGQRIMTVVSIWIVYNIVANTWACYMIKNTMDTLPQDLQQPTKEEAHLWHHCDICDMLVPPRAWHCKICNCCMLKRDHHCNFTGSCIGHNNHRYFLWLTFFMSLGTGMVLVFNAIDVLRHYRTNTFAELKKTVIFAINLVSFLVPAINFFIQLAAVIKNSTNFDKSGKDYSLGFWKNVQMVLGKRSFWTLISPTIDSPLAHHGSQWEVKEVKEN